MSKKNKNRNKKKNKGFKAGLIAGGILTLLYSSIFPLFRISDFLLCGGFAILFGKVISIMASGLDLTTHNKQDAKKRPSEVEELPLSGDENADAVIAKGQEMLHQIRAENDAITDEVLSSQMDEMERLCIQIFKTVAEKPQKASQIRKFMNYYLPTTLKMLASYRTMDQRGVSVSDMTEARSTLIRGMGMVLTACQKQLDNLYKETMLDVTTDIDVLEQMLKRDGFSDGELGAAGAKAPTATSAQMHKGTPVINAPVANNDDNFVSFYSNRTQQK
ncbi:MAG: 5-bromo-4-chloroindolyl phosphate hydrolysis family protein [Clostridia bacterium]|nr:5-bromo-4-chloroindolyl phosphate hydrolysis family protein [Clostridia bacterium]